MLSTILRNIVFDFIDAVIRFTIVSMRNILMGFAAGTFRPRNAFCPRVRVERNNGNKKTIETVRAHVSFAIRLRPDNNGLVTAKKVGRAILVIIRLF